MRPSKLVALIAFPLCLPVLALVTFLPAYYLPALVRSFLRSGEPNLPTATIEDGQTIYCRMRLCDFRFPIPSDARVERFLKVNGGGDTIDGEVIVISNRESTIDMEKYAEDLKQKGFSVSTCYECPSLTASSTNPLGGSIAVEDFSYKAARISFGYFGDY